LLAAAAGSAGAQATGAGGAPRPAEAAAPSPAWVLGVARFDVRENGAPSSASPIGEALPLLIAGRLATLPPRSTPPDEAAEAARLSSLRAIFAAGADLASKLDARSAAFLTPYASPEARDPAVKAADRAVAESRKKLMEITPDVGAAGDARAATLWSGNAGGDLVDAKAGAAAAAKASGVDLLVTGSIELLSGYAAVTVRGFDRALGREVFSWKGACSLEDPEPLAEETAIRLERWTAGKDFARLAIRVSPASARVEVDGVECGPERIVYDFEAGDAVVEAEADGFLPYRETLRLALGERRAIDVAMSPRILGSALVTVDPPGAAVSIDSVPAGAAPLSIPLDGTRGVLVARAEGRESASVVLPASGDQGVAISLLPSDGLGPAGRIEAAREAFFKALGWLVVAIPPTALSAGAYSLYSEADGRSPLESTSRSRVVSGIVLAASAVATATASVNAIAKLVRYLKAAR
jgi:hypothetical protein